MRGTKGELVDVADQTGPSTRDADVGRQMGKFDRSMNKRRGAESKAGMIMHTKQRKKQKRKGRSRVSR